MNPADVIATLTLQAGFNSAVVVAGTACLGVAAGAIGGFMLLRKRALVSDALSHATLPGIALAFLIATGLGLEGRSLPVLLTGALVSGLAGVLAIQAITRHTRLPEDAAIGAVLSVFFGVGVVLLSHIQTLATGNQAGLKTFILGQTAAMNQGEALALGALALAALAAAGLLFKEFRLLCFDPDFAAGQGWPTRRIDLALMGLTTLVTVIGLQTVGLILIVALLIVPAAAARFWTERLWVMVLVAAALGGASGWIGASLSALVPRLPAGAVIVLVAGALFLVSFLAAPARGVVATALRQARLRLAYAEQAALAAHEAGHPLDASPAIMAWLRLRGLAADGVLTERGRAAASAADRNRRLWERFLIRYPTLIPGQANWGIDPIDRVLPADMVRDLETGPAGMAHREIAG
ncbi:manganese transporter [Skermanella stibiiresistens SB22]|uniref:Manganese transporter n=1 Tax=Skermanella stibiiresistens SB22 TaxID=1385369 RepID=W9HCX0_9PROT|nr:iron chelate uptake ABC transporter family permease subunit [Skermanella stibiiresistens]EWY42552.1 manganese transporter [Skermanella stibiiresistens SB22]